MKDYSNFDCDVFSCTYEGQTAVIRFKSESFILAMNASKMHELLECLNAIEINAKIKGLLTLHTAEYERVGLTKEFIKSIQDKPDFVQKEMGVTRYGNSVKRLTLSLNEFSKPSVIGIHGPVAVDSFGCFLACDYRIATDNLSIEFPSVELGIVPTGAVAFFMKRQLGETKTLEILMAGKTIFADEAKSLSLVSEITTKDQLKAACIAKLEEFYKVPGHSTLNLTKQLVRPKTYELEEHFELSSRLMWNSIVDK